MVQDVRTRWNSTYDMLLRAYTLRASLREFVHNELDRKIKILVLDNREWEQIRYLLTLLKPFKDWTTALSKTAGVTITKTWYVYSRLLAHVDENRTRMSLKAIKWKQDVGIALNACQDKLKQYYDSPRTGQGRIYNLATILDPSNKTNLYRVSLLGNVRRQQ